MHRLLHLDPLLKLRFLELHSNSVLQLVDVPERIETEHGDGSAIRSAKSFDAFERSGFSGPVRADQPEDLAVVDLERDVIDGNRRFVGLSKSGNPDDCPIGAWRGRYR